MVVLLGLAYDGVVVQLEVAQDKFEQLGIRVHDNP